MEPRSPTPPTSLDDKSSTPPASLAVGTAAAPDGARQPTPPTVFSWLNPTVRSMSEEEGPGRPTHR